MISISRVGSQTRPAARSARAPSSATSKHAVITRCRSSDVCGFARLGQAPTGARISVSLLRAESGIRHQPSGGDLGNVGGVAPAPASARPEACNLLWNGFTTSLYAILYTARAQQKTLVTKRYKHLDGRRSLSSIAAAWKRLPWWIEPVSVVVILSIFGLYSFVIVSFLPGEYKDYLSPFYSPPIPRPDWMPAFITAPMFIIWIPLGFRATCYYYRKAYYRAFFWDPPACQAGAQEREPRKTENYRGERAVFVLNNVHRYFLYAPSWCSPFCGTTRFLHSFQEARSGSRWVRSSGWQTWFCSPRTASRATRCGI